MNMTKENKWLLRLRASKKMLGILESHAKKLRNILGSENSNIYEILDELEEIRIAQQTRPDRYVEKAERLKLEKKISERKAANALAIRKKIVRYHEALSRRICAIEASEAYVQIMERRLEEAREAQCERAYALKLSHEFGW